MSFQYLNVVKQRAHIKLCYKYNLNTKETYNFLQYAYEFMALTQEEFQKWYKYFQDGNTDIFGDYNFLSLQDMQAINEYIMDNYCLSKLALVTQLDKTETDIDDILYILSRIVYYGRIVPKELTEIEKNARLDYCKDIKNLVSDPSFHSNKTHHGLWPTVCGHMIWLVWNEKASYRSTSALDQPSTSALNQPPSTSQENLKKKLLLIIFYNQDGIIHFEFVKEDETSNYIYYVTALKNMLEKWYNICKLFQNSKKWYLLLENTPPNNVIAVREFLATRKVCVIYYPPYSPDVSPGEAYILNSLYSRLKLRFYEKWDIREIVDHMKRGPLFLLNLRTVFDNWMKNIDKCISVHGNYFYDGQLIPYE